MQQPPKHILVIRFSAMGDVAMTVPVIRCLLEQHPDLKITVLTRTEYRSIFYNLKNVSVFPARLKTKHKGVFGLWKLGQELKVLEFDGVADLHNVLRTNILKRFLFGNTFHQIDKGRKEKKALVTGQRFHQLKSTHERYADVFRSLGYDVDLGKTITPKPLDVEKGTRQLIGSMDKIVGIAPFAAYAGKMYPLNLIEPVIETISQSHKIVLFGGGQNESKQLEELALKYDNVANLAGKLSLKEELSVISNLSVMLAMDSANAHLAAMYAVPTVTLWGVTHPFAGFYPFGQPKENALLADRRQFPKIPTSVYGKSWPNGYEKAIETISPETVSTTIQKILND